MKRVMTIFLCFVLCFSLLACRSTQQDAGNSGSTQPSGTTSPEIPTTLPTVPTEPTVTTAPTEPVATTTPMPLLLQIIAPFDIYAENPDAAGDVEVTVVEGYRLLDNQSLPRFCSYDSMRLGNDYFTIQILPGILEDDLKNYAINYEVKTNYAGLFTARAGTEGYVGKQTTCKTHIHWRGLDVVPEEERDQVMPDRIWVDMVVKILDDIVGLVVFEIVPWEGRDDAFTIYYRYSEFYPMFDGRKQEVSEELVWQRIEAYHQLDQ